MKRVFQHPPEPLTGKKYWRSLGEYSNTPEFREWLEREFPAGASGIEAEIPNAVSLTPTSTNCGVSLDRTVEMVWLSWLKNCIRRLEKDCEPNWKRRFRK